MSDQAKPAVEARADAAPIGADVSSVGRDGHADGLTKVHALLTDSEQTQILPRLPPPSAPWKATSPAAASPKAAGSGSDLKDRLTAPADQTTVFARIAGHESSLPFAEESDTEQDSGEADADGAGDFEHAQGGDDTAGEPIDTVADSEGAADLADRAGGHHRAVWVALVVFWLLALGAGFICLASVGARATCTTSDKGLDCTNTGSGLAIALAVCVIVLVGILSVHAVDARDRAKVWLRDIGVGVVILAIIAYAGYLIIGTISG